MNITSFGGIDNVNPLSKVAANRFQEMTGVEVTNSGAAQRAVGCRIVNAGTARHSIHADAASVYFREGAGLYRLASTPELLDSSFVSPGGRTVYHTHFDRTYYSDASHNGVLQGGVARSWGLTPPPLPLASNDIGDLIPGRYHIGATYVRDDGQESGTSGLVSVECTGGLFISVSPSSDTTVTNIGVYVTSAGGNVPYLQALLPNAAWSGRISGNLGEGRPLDTNLCSPPAPCSCMAEYRGRMYMGAGSALWFSRSGNQYELVDALDKSFYPLGDDVTNIMPVDDGIWVTTLNASMFLMGSDPHEGAGLVVKFKQAVGGFKHSGQVTDADAIKSRVPLQGKVALWSSAAGVCLGGAGGYFNNITGDYFQPARVTNGMSFCRSRRDMDQYVFGILASEFAFSMTDPADTLTVSTDNVP